ncbi:MAG: PEP-CTERM sorting domain-containing protein [Methylococcales bacterium]|nr:PEP-CTERM sorting domain-containing protein [Methylococcales bacterium]
MLKTVKTASIAGVFATLLMMSTLAEAAMVRYSFDGVIDSGSLFGESYSGFLLFDDASLTYTGAESVTLSDFSMAFLTNTFAISTADFAPTADFSEGVFLGISYAVSSFDPQFALIASSGLGGAFDRPYFSYTTLLGDSGFGTLQFVPEPISMALYTLGLAGMGLFRRYRQLTV